MADGVKTLFAFFVYIYQECVVKGVGTYMKLFCKLFAVGFFLFWFGFLAAAAYVCIRDQDYGTLIFSIPFWLVGFQFAKARLLPDAGHKKNRAGSGMVIPIVVSAFLVVTALLAGIVLVVLGVKNGDIGLIFAGAFFAFGAFTFVLAALTIQGRFDKLKMDVLGLYMGTLIAAMGAGIIVFKYSETRSLQQTVELFGLWIAVPLLMIIAGTIKLIQCLRERKNGDE